MSEGYTVEDIHGETIGIVVRNEGARGFRFFSSAHAFDALEGHVFASAQAAQQAARDFRKNGRTLRAATRSRAEAVA